MIDEAQARRIAAKEIGDGQPSGYGFTPAIIDDATKEIPEGWVFFYNSREYLETGDFSFCLAGNAPVVVCREDGRVLVTGTAEPLETYLERLFPERQKTS